MKECERFNNLISAYNDNELTKEERKLVEQHLETCDACREKLTRYRYSSAEIIKLQIPEPEADIRNVTMAKLATLNASNGQQRKKLAEIFLPIILILAILLPITLGGGASSVLAKAYAAIEKLESYRETTKYYTYFPDTEEKVLSSSDESVFGGNDTFRVKYYPSGTGYYREVIVVDGNYYWFGRQIVRNTTPITYFDAGTPTREKTLDYLELIEDVQTLDDEVINGTECYHYKGTVNIEKYLERTLPRIRALYERMQFDYIEEMIEYRKRYWQNREIVYELWVGKDDYLIRQITDTNGLAANPFYISILVQNFYDFNEPVDIVPPLDENGEMLEGWYVQPLGEY